MYSIIYIHSYVFKQMYSIVNIHSYVFIFNYIYSNIYIQTYLGTDLKGLVELHVGHNTWGQYAEALGNPENFEWPRAGRNDDEAHPPIHPTKSLELASLEPQEKNIYELITRHFLACCSKDAVGYQTQVDIDVSAEVFSTKYVMCDYICEYDYVNI